MISKDSDPILGRYGKSADILSFFAIVLSIIYLGIQSRLPSRSHYQNPAKSQSLAKEETVYFSKYLADPVASNDREAKVTAIVKDDADDQNGSMIDKFPFLKYILADQDIKDESAQITAPTCQKSSADCQKVKDEKAWAVKTVNKPTDNFSFFKTLFSDTTGAEHESSFFHDLSSKIHKSDLYAQLFNLLADDDTELKGKSTPSKSKETKASNSFFSLSLPSFDSIFADPDIANAFSGGKKTTEEAQNQNIEVEKESKKIQKTENVVEQEIKLDNPAKETRLETDDLLEAFKIFLKGYSAGKDSKVSEKVDYKVAFESLKPESKSSDKKIPVKREGASISAILRSFLVDEEFHLDEIREESTTVPDSVDATQDQNYILNALAGLLAENNENRSVKPAADFADALQRFLVDDKQQQETYQNGEYKEKEEPSKTHIGGQQEESEVVKLLKGFLANEKEEKVLGSQNIQDPDTDSQSFFSSLLVDVEKDAKQSDAKKALGGARIVSFFKNQIKKEKSSTQNNGKGPVKNFLDLFASFLAESDVNEEVSNDDPFHKNIKSALLTGEETNNGLFSDEIDKFSSYLKKFIYSDGQARNTRKNQCKDHDKDEGNLFESLIGNILA